MGCIGLAAAVALAPGSRALSSWGWASCAPLALSSPLIFDGPTANPPGLTIGRAGGRLRFGPFAFALWRLRFTCVAF